MAILLTFSADEAVLMVVEPEKEQLQEECTLVDIFKWLLENSITEFCDCLAYS